jgi:aspartate racemase
LGESILKTIGLIGGMSWESSAEYYRLINERVKEKCGGLHSAKCILFSVDFEEIEKYQREENWEKATQLLIEAAQSLEKAGADFIIICTNTMHKLADQIREAIRVPLLHIADTTADKILERGIKTIGLLGTKYTMEQEFYKVRLERRGIKVLIPNKTDRKIVHDIIYNELCLGKVLPESKESYKRIIEDLKNQGTQGIILGCTEITLLVKPEDSDVPLFDTTLIHAIKAVELALGENS